MADGPLHVVFGAGNVGRALAAHLSGLGLSVRVVSRSQPSELPGAVEWRGADAGDAAAATEAGSGATVIYQCLNAPYPKWTELFPPLQRGVLAAAERNGALLVSLENLYGYGIGTFNDRIRDGIRGGSSFDTSAEQVQGFATGLFTDPSVYTTTTLGETLAEQKTTLNSQADWIRAGLAGNRHHVEHFHVRQREAVIGHEHLERGVAVVDQRGKLLAEHAVGRVRDDEMERHVHIAIAVRLGVIVLHHLP